MKTPAIQIREVLKREKGNEPLPHCNRYKREEYVLFSGLGGNL